MYKLPTLATVALSLAACTAPPANPMEQAARRAAGAEHVARNCAGFVGGFSDVRELKQRADQEIVTARKLGATDADLQKAKADVQNVFMVSEAFTDRRQACNAMISELAWAMS